MSGGTGSPEQMRAHGEPDNINGQGESISSTRTQKIILEVLLSEDASDNRSAATTLDESSIRDRHENDSPAMAAKVLARPNRRQGHTPLRKKVWAPVEPHAGSVTGQSEPSYLGYDKHGVNIVRSR